ncbi:hypothetical protein PM082_006071 [Marasmius tenuissimus]|nr:hypothetical protein PM082_006071 [Marasmius tenuissimus]
MTKVSYTLVELDKPTDEQLNELASLLQTAFHSEDDRSVIATLAGGPGKEGKFHRSVIAAGRIVVAMKDESNQIIGCAIWYKPKENEEQVNEGCVQTLSLNSNFAFHHRISKD